jgi:hypothetical protein
MPEPQPFRDPQAAGGSSLFTSLAFAKPTGLRIVEASNERLVVRTKMFALWLGLPALAMFVAIVGGGLWQFGHAVLTGRLMEALVSVTGTLASGAFIALFLIGFLNQRLVATREGVEILSKIGPVAWRRMRFAEMAEVGCITIDGEEGDSYELEVKANGGLVRFGSESKEQNVRLLAERLCQVCRMCRAAVPPAVSESQPAGAEPKLIPAKTIRRQKKKS